MREVAGGIRPSRMARDRTRGAICPWLACRCDLRAPSGNNRGEDNSPADQYSTATRQIKYCLCVVAMLGMDTQTLGEVPLCVLLRDTQHP